VSELRRVSGPPSRIDRNLGRILVIVLVAVLIAVVKPWGAVHEGSQAILAPRPSPSPSPSPSPTTQLGPRQYDIVTFGIREPPPTWEVWSAGNLASFRFALRVDLSTPIVPGSSPVASNAVAPVGSASDIPVDWPIVEVPSGSQLDLIALNRPLGHTIEVVSLTRDNDSGGGQTVVHPILGVSPWPSHFTTIGLGTGDDTAGMQQWPTGTYHLDLSIGPAGTTRSLEIMVDKTQSSSSPAVPAPDEATPTGSTPSADAS
jgi:hypothetical protein